MQDTFCSNERSEVEAEKSYENVIVSLGDSGGLFQDKWDLNESDDVS